MTEITSRLSTALADRYRIESRLGEGGMATVYLAEDLKHDGESSAPAHPPASRFGEADSFLCYVMSFIDGETQLGIDEAIGVTTDVAGALDYAHQQVPSGSQ